MAWQTLFSFKLAQDPTQNTFICVRVTLPPEGFARITDIRRFVNNKALKIGVSLLPPEVEWVMKTIKTSETGCIETETRSVMVSTFPEYTSITVQKVDGLSESIPKYF